MLNHKRIATLAAVTAIAIVPSLGIQSAGATIAPVKPCELKWILAPPTSFQTDLENQHTTTQTGSGTYGGYPTVEFDDPRYPDC